MPVVQTYGPQKADLAPLPGVRKTAAETPASLGAGVAQAEGQQADVLAGIGRQGMQIAASEYEKLQQQSRDDADQAARLDWQNKLANFEKDTINDPEHGVLTVNGIDAMGLPPRVTDAYNKLADSIASVLSNDRQRMAFAKDRQERGQSIDLQVLRHVDQQVKTYHANELDATVKGAQELAISKAQDPHGAGLELQRGADALVTSGPKLFGWGPEETRQKVQDFYSRAHVGIVENLIDNQKIDAARLYYQDAKDGINGDQRGRLEKALELAGTTQAGLDTATTIWQQLGPKDDDAPINLDQMENAALDKFKNQPEAYRATVGFLREKKAAVDASRQDRAQQISGDVWLAASQGQSLQQIRQMKAFRDLPPRAQVQVQDYMIGRMEHAANIAAADENRAYLHESRIYTMEQRQQAEKERAGWSRYWDASRPEVLDQTSEGALQSMRGDLGDDLVNRLLTQKRALVKGEETVRAVTLDDAMFKTIANSAGVKAYPGPGAPLSEDEKAQLGQLQDVVKAAIDREQVARGKTLGREEKQKLMQGIVDQKVMLDYWWPFSDQAKVAALVTGEERGIAYVPMAQIPASALTQALTYIRQVDANMKGKSDDDVRKTYTDRIQRAYARRLTGGTRAEMEAVLQGKQ